MKVDVNKVITLGNKEKYLVLSHVVSGGNDYFYIAQLDENEKDIKDNYKIMLKTEKDNKIFLDEVVGESNLKVVLPLFVKDMV